jgi:hypothetical protein
VRRQLMRSWTECAGRGDTEGRRAVLPTFCSLAGLLS